MRHSMLRRVGWPILMAAAWGVLASTGLATSAAADEPPAAAPATAPETRSEPGVSPPSDDKPVAAAKSDASPAEFAAMLLGSLTPEHMKQLGQMLEQDWKRRPEWGDMAVAILKGESMRVGMGWFRPSVKRYDWSWLSGHFDADGDGRVRRGELPEQVPNADRLFARLDADSDGQVTPGDFEEMPRGPGTPAAMMGEFLFFKLDRDSNGRVSLDELAQFFAAADAEDLGFLTPEDIRSALGRPEQRTAPPRSDLPSHADMIQLLFRGELGWLEPGPAYGDSAPDFTLPTYDGTSSVTLSTSRGQRPVVLIFGSFT